MIQSPISPAEFARRILHALATEDKDTALTASLDLALETLRTNGFEAGVDLIEAARREGGAGTR